MYETFYGNALGMEARGADLADSALPDRITIVPPERPHLDRTIWVEWFGWPRTFTEQFYTMLAADPKTPILVAIDSYGGSAYGLFHILGVIKASPVPVWTCVFGTAMSAAFALASAGAPGKRFAMPYARGMMHHVQSGTWGDLETIKAQVGEMQAIDDMYLSIIAENSGRKVADLKAELDESPEQFLSAAGMVKFGLVDQIVTNILDVLPAGDKPEAGEAPAAPAEGAVNG